MKLDQFGGLGWEITLCFHSCSLSANLIFLKLSSLEMKGVFLPASALLCWVLSSGSAPGE